jgi:Carboxypeptidase regulatory-like domain
MRRHGDVMAAVIVVAVAVGVWFARRDSGERAGSQVHYRDARTPLAPRRAPQLGEGSRPGNHAQLDDGVQRLEGRVLGLAANGTETARVTLASDADRVTTTTPDGQFSFDGVAPGMYRVLAQSGDRIAGPVRVGVGAAAVDGGVRPVSLRLSEGVFVTVTVVDDAQQPIAGAHVRVAVGEHRVVVETGAGGDVACGPLPTGYASVEAEAAGRAPMRAGIALGSPGARGAVTIVVYRGVPVSGRVVDARGAPIAGARVTVMAMLDSTGPPAVSDERGAFTIPMLARGHYALQVTDDEHPSSRSGPVLVHGAAIDGVEIVMPDGGVATGVALDDQRRPVPFTVVIARHRGRVQQTMADATGSFELRGLVRGPLSLHAESPSAMSALVRVDLTDSGEADLELVLDIAGAIAGMVVDENGAGLAGIAVTAYPDYERVPAGFGHPLRTVDAVTDEDGRFVVRGVPDAPYRLYAQRCTTCQRMSLSPSTPARAGDQDVRIALPRDGELVGRVAVDRGAPPRNVGVSLGGRPATLDPDGRFRIAGVPPGSYRLAVHSLDFPALYRDQVEIRSGATTDLGTLIGTRARALGGRVVDGAGVPVAGARIGLGVIRPAPVEPDDPPAGFHAYRTALAAPDGRFVIGVLPPVAQTAIASAVGFGSSAPVVIPGEASVPGDPPEVTFVLSALPDEP